MNTLISPGIFNVFGSDWEVPFCSWALLLPRQASGGSLLVGSCLPVGPTPQSPRDGPCVPVEVSAVALATCPGVSGGVHLSLPCWGSQGFCSAGTLSPALPGQLWVCRCWRGKKVCVHWVMAVLCLFAVSFVGCCPNRKANYFVYAELIMSEQSAFVCL